MYTCSKTAGPDGLFEHSSRISQVLNYVFQLFAPGYNIGLDFLTRPRLLNNGFCTYNIQFACIGRVNRSLGEPNMTKETVIAKSAIIGHSGPRYQKT